MRTPRISSQVGAGNCFGVQLSNLRFVFSWHFFIGRDRMLETEAYLFEYCHFFDIVG
jgi:hypothetical protein